MTTTRIGDTRSKTRFNFAKLEDAILMPYLIETQQKSYEDFLQTTIAPHKRQETGLQAAFLSIFPITSTSTLAAVILSDIHPLGKSAPQDGPRPVPVA